MNKLSDASKRQGVNELERDVMALGSVVFYFLVIGRALIGPFWDLFTPLVLVAVILVLVNQFSKEVDLYIARGLVMAVLVTRHYNDVVFGIFAALVLIAMVFSALRLGNSKQKITGGILIGLVCSVVAYIVAESLG